MTVGHATESPASSPLAAARPRGPVRVLFALPGLHRVNRGAEVALESIARELARIAGFDVTLLGSGDTRPGEPYRFLHAGCIDRTRFERIPCLPVLRNETAWEEMTFLPGMLRRYRPRDFDVTVACSFPFVHWALTARGRRSTRPAHVFVTENGDWPCLRVNSEFRWFACDGLVCTNNEYFDRNRERWRSALIPNGVDPSTFRPGPGERARLGIPDGAPVVLTVSALIPSKRVIEGMEAVARVDGAHLVVAGDGPLRDELDRRAAAAMPGRFRRVAVRREEMPALYRSADAMLHMSQDEPSSVAYIEALATGLPIVTHDRDVTRWTFDGNAVLVDTDDRDRVAAAVRDVLGWTPERRARARDASVALARRRFAWPIIAAQYAEFLREVLEHRRSGSVSAG